MVVRCWRHGVFYAFMISAFFSSTEFGGCDPRRCFLNLFKKFSLPSIPFPYEARKVKEAGMIYLPFLLRSDKAVTAVSLKRRSFCDVYRLLEINPKKVWGKSPPKTVSPEFLTLKPFLSLQEFIKITLSVSSSYWPHSTLPKKLSWLCCSVFACFSSFWGDSLRPQLFSHLAFSYCEDGNGNLEVVYLLELRLEINLHSSIYFL